MFYIERLNRKQKSKKLKKKSANLLAIEMFHREHKCQIIHKAAETTTMAADRTITISPTTKRTMMRKKMLVETTKTNLSTAIIRQLPKI